MNKHKHYKIVNKKRFIAFITLVILIVTFSAVGVFGLVQARASEKTEVIEVEVCYGDTIWDLAKQYGNAKKDIRELVYDICSINNIDAYNLQSGQIILIPVK